MTKLTYLPLLTALLASDLHAQRTRPVFGDSVETAAFEDYTRSAGVPGSDGVLRVHLDARTAAWQPWGPDGPALRTNVFSADGDAPRTPAPLIRVRVNTPVHVTVRNSLGDRLILRGMRDRAGLPAPPNPGAAAQIAFLGDSLDVMPGTEASLSFTPTSVGTFFYFARTIDREGNSLLPTPLPARAEDRSLWGVIIVDPPEPEPLPAERILVITHWGERALPGSFLPASRFFVNGASWPHTERLSYRQGDTIRWRVLNLTGRPHPMHLHGAYFTVDARGDALQERSVAPAQRRLAVTEILDIAQTMRLSWVAHEPGNWLFHCHFMRHMSWLQTSAPDAPPDRHAHHDAAGEDLLGGLVVGVTVAPRDDYTPPSEPVRRRLDLYITKRDRVFGDAPAYGFVLRTDAPPAPDSVRFPGSGITLTRGEPASIVVHNRADVALGVHWHGLELESRADGVPGWSGLSGTTVPAIAPGDSLSVRITPPRAGTFMYHVHSEPSHELAQGLYGPFIVREPDDEALHDRLFLLGSLGTGEDPPPVINGMFEHGPLELAAGASYRMRFMHISPDDDKRVTLLGPGERPTEWRLIAKDGADLPAVQARTVPANLRIGVGETYDFLWTPEPGSYTLRVLTTFDSGAGGFPREAPPPHTADIRITVR